ncbi:MAG: glycosyltransferase family 4 protein [Pseudomonadota bacterium]|nr:glycosyltransferase family 4 protein [Pseudomonadota bacterium]
MKILFIHQNFPGQFVHLAPALAARPGVEVAALTLQKIPRDNWRGVRILRYGLGRGTTPDIHPWVLDFESKVIRAEACFRAALQLRDQGYRPDIIVAHPGWGESLFLKEVWPEARLGIYCEFFYHASGADVGFDPEFPSADPGVPCRLTMKNVNNLLHFDIADGGISPTHWQASTFPEPFRSRITVVHDGIDTDHIRPAEDVRIRINDTQVLGRGDQVITFVNRNMEPTRGYHSFMRALPTVLRDNPDARVILVGGDGTGYGAQPPKGTTWKQTFIDEVRPAMAEADWRRVHFVGKIPHDHFLRLLQVSTVHVYLTYPFVLSWSLLEAMSAGCAIVGSDTAPLHEAIRHGDTGRLVNFFDHGALAAEIGRLLRDPAERQRLGANARQFARAHYDLKRICLPRQLAWVESLQS